MLIPGVILPQVKDSAFILIELYLVLPCPSLQPAKVPPKGCTALWVIGLSSQLCGISQLAEEAPASSSKFKDKLNTGPRIEPWRTSSSVTSLQLEPVPLIMTSGIQSNFN